MGLMKFRGTGVKQEILSMLQNDVKQVLIGLESVQFRAVYRIAKLESNPTCAEFPQNNVWVKFLRPVPC